METASADSMPEGVERQGIGTPATRAATIEKLNDEQAAEAKKDKTIAEQADTIELLKGCIMELADVVYGDGGEVTA